MIRSIEIRVKSEKWENVYRLVNLIHMLQKLIKFMRW